MKKWTNTRTSIYYSFNTISMYNIITVIIHSKMCYYYFPIYCGQVWHCAVDVIVRILPTSYTIYNIYNIDRLKLTIQL